MASAAQLLDQVQTVAHLEAFAIDRFVDQLRRELPAPASPTLAGIDALDAGLRAALAAVDAFAARSMRMKLDHALAADTSLGTPFRKVVATTILAYAGNLELLRERVAGTAVRVDPGGAATTADTVVGVARDVLERWRELRAGVLAIVRELAAAVLPDARRAATDRATDDAIRLRWSAARRELELIGEQPERIAAAPFAERIAALPALLDEPEPVREPTFGELIELD